MPNNVIGAIVIGFGVFCMGCGYLLGAFCRACELDDARREGFDEGRKRERATHSAKVPVATVKEEGSNIEYVHGFEWKRFGQGINRG
jgi:hypothetical protein